jgi:methionyl-tRNA formyltransferase
MALRVALFGQADFGRMCLDRLIEGGHEIAAVFAPPDTGRPDALAARAAELGLPLTQRRYYQRKDGTPIPAALESYRKLYVDLNVLASFTAFLPPAIANAPTQKSICFHPSLLPRFRGGAALQWQIILGERESGVTIFVPDEGVDTGPIVVQKGGVEIGPEDTTGSLFFKKLSPLGVEAVVEAVNQIDAGTARLILQDASHATFQGLVDDSVAAIDLERPAVEIDRLVRGCDPQPGAFVHFRGEPLRLYDARLEPGSGGEPGTVIAIDEAALRLALRGAPLRVGRVRAERGKEAAREFAERNGLKVGDRLESG